MHIIMYISVLLIIIITVSGGYKSGIFETSFMFFRNVIGFLLAFTFFSAITNLILSAVPDLSAYPFPEYVRSAVFASAFIIFISACDWIRYKYLFPSIRITINKYADRGLGALLGVLNGIVLSGFILILWTTLPFVPFIPGDFGYVNTDRLPVDSGAILLKTYAHTTNRLGGRTFPLKRSFEDSDQEEDIRQNGWLQYYRSHADFSSDDLDRITDNSSADTTDR